MDIRVIVVITKMFDDANMFDDVVDKVYIDWSGRPKIVLYDKTILIATYKTANSLIRYYRHYKG